MRKKYRTTLISLVAALLTAVLIAVSVFALRTTYVFASDRFVTIDGSNVFYTSIRGAEITSGAETVTEGEGETQETEEHYYTLFKIGKDETVSYRKSLAYMWYSGSEHLDDDGNPTGEYEQYYFDMTIGFDKLNFEKFIIEFQSQQYLASEDDITKNYLVFAPNATQEGLLDIAAVRDIEESVESYPVSVNAADNERIEISFCEFRSGEVTISINGEPSALYFENVYFPYAGYVSSGDSACTPLTFSAQFADGATAAEGEDELTADMKLYELNGQSFELFAHDGDGVYNDAMDDAPPVICFTRTPSYVKFGSAVDFDYQVIDVLATSPRATACFYVLSGDQYKATDFNYMQTEYDETEDDDGGSESEGEGEGEEGETVYENPFIKITSGSDIRVIRDENTFVPSDFLKSKTDYTVYGLIKVYYEITDVTGSSAKTDKVFADWYAKKDAIVNVFDLKKETVDDAAKKNTGNFLRIMDGKDGVTYAAVSDTNLTKYKETINAIEASYQAKIDAAIGELEDGKLYAGGESKFYLPEFNLLASTATDSNSGDKYCTLQDYKYSIYYKGNTTGTNLSLDYNELSIPLNDADATYRFTIFVTDEFNNPMRYPDTTSNGAFIWKEITTDDIWDEDFYDLLPFFEFDVSYKKATAKNPESLSVAYVGTSYSGVSFDIKDSAKTSTATYNLYIFDRNAAFADLGEIDYDEFVENYEKLFTNTYADGVNTRKYFTTVKPSADLKESDANYDEFKAINWNSTNVSFTPQSAEDFYVVRLTLTDNRSQLSDTYFATVRASIQANSLKGETEWLQNNIVSVVLLSVAGVLFIAFIILLVVKPKDKGDIDEIYEKEKKKGEKKSK